MQVICYKKYNYSEPIILTIGMFDGVHKAHQKIIHFINKIGIKKKIPSCLLTFEPHPRFLIKQKNNKFKLLTLLKEKIYKLSNLKLSRLIIQKFDKNIRDLSPEEFVENILIRKLNIEILVIGHDHQFGKNRKGNLDTLINLSKKFGFKVIQISLIQNKKNIISSTNIRHSLLTGNLNLANCLLGDYYTLSGKVIEGLGIAKKIGFPTANISISKNKLIPKKGVYFVEVLIGKKILLGIMNIGNRPTFKGKKNQIEVHILNFKKNIYGSDILIKIKNYIREEIKFKSVYELIEQIKKDKIYVKNYLQ